MGGSRCERESGFASESLGFQVLRRRNSWLMRRSLAVNRADAELRGSRGNCRSKIPVGIVGQNCAFGVTLNALHGSSAGCATKHSGQRFQTLRTTHNFRSMTGIYLCRSVVRAAIYQFIT
jgi:hypothetical protein